MVGAAAPSAVASEQAAIKAETLSTAEPLSTASPLPPPPPQPHEAKRRRLSATSSLPLWPSTRWAGRPLRSSAPGGPRCCSPGAQPDVDAADWWSLDQLPQVSPGRFALEQLRQYIQDWERAKKDDFWQRKSGKVALSVVVCRGMEDGALVAYRGMNTEVSLPAGSLCSERAAIGRAASSFQRASDILVAATADPQERLNPLWPCEVCQSWLAKLRAQNPDISVLAVESISPVRQVRCPGERRDAAPTSGVAASECGARPVAEPRGLGGG
ncbi:unnamed protein product [Prorocentrum cordatum]|uniref:Cytidine deaminase n=1 Tax=Prorocentrum cordatum TaxID=2364126 RepID=A0ABN9UX67_9DINO|nr:unnamed protein product [Polarella glacialis]